MNTIDWCRQLIDELKDGGVWGIPRTGVVFRKTGRDRLTWVGNMPAREKGGEDHREDEFRSNREQFGAAGVLVDREEKMMGFDDIDAARNFYNVMESLSGDSYTQSRTDPALDFRGLKIEQKGDQFIIEKDDDPNAIPAAAAELTDRLHVPDNMPMFGKPSNDPRHGKVAQFTGRYDDIRTERATGADHSIAKMLLRSASPIGNKTWADNFSDSVKGAAALADAVNAVADDRPLIDRLHEATFHNPVGMKWIKEKYDFRMILRKAHCFTLDRDTSRLVADFSVAISKDLESARQMAIPPFPVTWIDLDNQARIDRVKELGIPLTRTASGDSDLGPVVPRVGWLIWPATDLGGFYVAYCCEVEQSLMLAPLCYWWHTSRPNPDPVNDVETKHDFMSFLTFGVSKSNVNPADAYPAVTPLHVDILQKEAYRDDVRDLMSELAGELRHIWGFLIALGAGQLGLEARTSPQAAPKTERRMPNGKPLLALEHKVLHLHLAKKSTVDKVVARMVTHHKNREHEVRAHFRTYRNEDGTVRMRVPIPSHKRGDERLGKIEKTYKVER